MKKNIMITIATCLFFGITVNVFAGQKKIKQKQYKDQIFITKSMVKDILKSGDCSNINLAKWGGIYKEKVSDFKCYALKKDYLVNDVLGHRVDGNKISTPAKILSVTENNFVEIFDSADSDEGLMCHFLPYVSTEVSEFERNSCFEQYMEGIKDLKTKATRTIEAKVIEFKYGNWLSKYIVAKRYLCFEGKGQSTYDVLPWKSFTHYYVFPLEQIPVTENITADLNKTTENFNSQNRTIDFGKNG
jgi:hypothetical protein